MISEKKNPQTTVRAANLPNLLTEFTFFPYSIFALALSLLRVGRWLCSIKGSKGKAKDNWPSLISLSSSGWRWEHLMWLTDSQSLLLYRCLLEVQVTVVTVLLGCRVLPFRSRQVNRNQSDRPWTSGGRDDKGSTAWVHRRPECTWLLLTQNDYRCSSLHFLARFLSVVVYFFFIVIIVASDSCRKNKPELMLWASFKRRRIFGIGNKSQWKTLTTMHEF